MQTGLIIYLEEVEGVGDAELHLLSVHSWGIVSVELHQVLRLVDGAQLHKRLQGLTTYSFLTTCVEKTQHAQFCNELHFTELHVSKGADSFSFSVQRA